MSIDEQQEEDAAWERIWFIQLSNATDNLLTLSVLEKTLGRNKLLNAKYSS